MKRACLTCEFYAADASECRYDPPRAQIMPTGPGLDGKPKVQPVSFFPQIPDSLWCGKWAERQQ